MRLVELFVAGIGVFALLHFLLIPLTEKSAERCAPARAVARAALASMLGFFKSLSAVMVITCGSLLAILAWIQRGGGGSEKELAASIERARSAQEPLSVLAGGWSAFFVLALTGALAILAYRNGRRRAVERLRAGYQEAFEELSRRREAGELEHLPPTQDMIALTRRVDELERALARLEPRERGPIELEIARARQAYVILDIERRMRESAFLRESDPVAGWSSRLQVFLTSKGWFASLQGVSKGLSYGGLALLLLSFVAFHSTSVHAKLGDRIVQLSELRLAMRKDALYSDYRGIYETQAPAEATGALDDEDEEAIDALSRLFEDGLLGPSDGPDAPPEDAYELGRLAARNSILRAARAASHSDAGFTISDSMSRAEGLTAAQRRGLGPLENVTTSRGPRTRIGERFREALRAQVPATERALWSSVKSKVSLHMASYREPVAMRDVGRMLVGEVLGTAVEGAVPLADDVVGEMAGEVLSRTSSGAVEEFFDIKTREFLIDIARSDDAEAALMNFRGRASSPVRGDAVRAIVELRSSVPSTESTLRVLRDSPPAVGRMPEAHVDSARVAEAVRGTRGLFEASSGGLRADVLTDTLLSYSDLAPPHLNAERHTELGKLLASNDPGWFGPEESAGAGGGGGGGGGGGASRGGARGSSPRRASPSTTSRSRTSFSRGRSFVRMRGFSRVGGVVIGREPASDDDAPEILEFGWSRDGSRVSFALTPSRGDPIHLGPYRASIVHQALVYAADGRPLTVTMTSAPPLQDLKIHLHPALIDTALGCKAIELDRFVDTFVGSDPGSPRHEATERIYRDAEFYELAWSCRALALLSTLGSAESLEITSLVEEHGVLSAIAEQLGALGVELDSGFLEIEGLWESVESSESLLRRKSAFYDPELVQALRRHLTSETVLDELAEALYADFRALTSRLGDPDRDLVAKWLQSPPDFQIWSGVREAPFDLDETLSALVAPQNEELWPLDFMIQVAFASEPAFLPSDAAAVYYDDDPLEFDGIRDDIHRAVSRGLSADPDARTVFEDMREFTILQRLFRCALDGRLGDSFPLASLVALTEATGDTASAPVRTLRWNARPGMAEFETQVRLAAFVAAAASTEVEDPLGRRAVELADALTAAVAGVEDLERLSTEDWEAIFDTGELLEDLTSSCEQEWLAPSPACGLLPPLLSLTLSAQARTLRRALGVPADDAQILSRAGCPSIP